MVNEELLNETMKRIKIPDWSKAELSNYLFRGHVPQSDFLQAILRDSLRATFWWACAGDKKDIPKYLVLINGGIFPEESVGSRERLRSWKGLLL